MPQKTIRWLQWAQSDLQNGLGGVEVHARSIAENLRDLGVDAHLSSDPVVMRAQPWNVIHTHGSTRLPPSVRSALQGQTLFIHTLHGTAYGRMSACGEWLWPRGHQVALVEIEAALRSDLLFSVHSQLWLHRFARLIKGSERAMVCGNGWDAAQKQTRQREDLPDLLTRFLAAGEKFWIYVGRGGDVVKNTSLLEAALTLRPDHRLIAIPGEGFNPSNPQILQTGVLSSAQIQTLLFERSSQIHGLVLTSKYEGLPLVILECLAHAVPVITTPVGGLSTLSPELRGLHFLKEASVASLNETMDSVAGIGTPTPSTRESTLIHNRSLLQSWKSVSEIYLDSVQKTLPQIIRSP